MTYEGNRCNCIDIVKLVCCVLIIGSHTLPLFSSDTLNYYYGQCFFRFCVPFFYDHRILFLQHDVTETD